MSIPARLTFHILQGATFAEALERVTYPYPVRLECGRLVKEDGSAAPAADAVPENYTGCTARVQLRRDIDSQDVIAELTTENDGIVLDGAWLRLNLSAIQTAAFAYGGVAPAWETCIGQVEVTRPGGEVERQYELTFVLHPEGTR